MLPVLQPVELDSVTPRAILRISDITPTPSCPSVDQNHQQVYAYDQRFHGDSDSPSHGFHVARLAADLRDFLTALQLTDVTVVGSSMGCAVIWSYVELFGPQRLRQAVFVVSGCRELHSSCTLNYDMQQRGVLLPFCVLCC
jgi:pimeloyl-ACP methyl ester carboxylesterase